MNITLRNARTTVAAILTIAGITAGSIFVTATPASASETIITDWVTVSDRQNTDFLMGLPIEKFDPALGDFLAIEVTSSVAFESEFWVSSNNTTPQQVRVVGDSTLFLSTPAAPDFSQTVDIQTFNTGFITLVGDETYHDVITSEHRLPDYRSTDTGWVGPGTAIVTYESLSGVTFTGGGGQVSGSQATYGTVTVSYRYTYQTRDVATTPTAPTITTGAACGTEQSVIVPAHDGVTYTQTRDGSIVTVTANLAAGYVLAEGATASWSLTIPAIVACPIVVDPVDPPVDSAQPPLTVGSAPAGEAKTNLPTALARTGVDAIPVIWLGGALIAAGSAMLISRRRRSPSRSLC